MREDGLAKLVAGGAVALVTIAGAALAVIQDRFERGLLDGGHCERIMEALYTPPPSLTTICSSTNPPICTTTAISPIRSCGHCGGAMILRAGAQRWSSGAGLPGRVSK